MTAPIHEATIRSRFAQAEQLAGEMADLQAGWCWECHPFVQRWLTGDLSAAELQAFAAEHHHVVVALAEAARQTGEMTGGLLGEQLSRYAAEQDRAVQRSCTFAVATGWGRSSWYFAADPLESTAACGRVWSGEGRSLAERLAGAAAIECALGRFAPELLDALTLRYGFDAPATRYFARCAERSANDAAMLGAGLTSVLPLPETAELLRHAEMALRAYWELLDGVQRLSMTFS
jgi:pyrroloquinoline quinone (PQQ) biosynthesis protein C